MTDDISFYINFALCAVLGRTSHADNLMRRAGDAIRSVADYIARRMPMTPQPLYRGLLLDPTTPYVTHPKLTFLSWSEDRQVAEWFACKGSVISEDVVHIYPHYRGYIITLPALRSRVLFHYSWATAFNGLADLALRHPLMGKEGQRQIAWALQTQREVITEPADGLEPKPVAALDAAALDQRFTPPWMRRAR